MRVSLERLVSHPGRVVSAAYMVGWLLGTILLLLPVCTAPGNHTGWWQASFTAMSALCITGLNVVDPGTHWSHAGQVVILSLIQMGGFGIMTMTSLILFRIAGRVSHTTARVAQAETRAQLTGIGRMPWRILRLTLLIEGTVAVLLTGRFLLLGMQWDQALYRGVFHAISAFNNAGFSLWPDNMIGFNADPWVMLPICAAIVLGGLGFPVHLELLRRWRGLRAGARRRPSVHLQLTLIGTAVLLLAGFCTFALFEWNNPGTLGPQSLTGKLLGCLGGAVFPRTAGFNSIDYGAINDATIAVNYGLMMIGGGSAGTAGGLKIATVAVLLLAVATEVAGEQKTVFRGRKISSALTRQALAVTVLGTAAVFVAILALASIEPAPLHVVTFEAISAFATVGLSMNLTPTLQPASLGVVEALMFLGRVGPVSVAAALAMHRHPRRYQLPQEDPLVG
ncbi:potassium transporter TrkG [Luteococcus sediminum]